MTTGDVLGVAALCVTVLSGMVGAAWYAGQRLARIEARLDAMGESVRIFAARLLDHLRGGVA